MNAVVKGNVRDFILGGKSEFTILNTVSNKCGKYKVKADRGIYYVSFKDGDKFQYIGYLKNSKWFKGKRGLMEECEEPVRALLWVLKKSDPRVQVIHHGRCACCGRKLDDTVSIERGIGPVCYKKMKAF